MSDAFPPHKIYFLLTLNYFKSPSTQAHVSKRIFQVSGQQCYSTADIMIVIEKEIFELIFHLKCTLKILLFYFGK